MKSKLMLAILSPAGFLSLSIAASAQAPPATPPASASNAGTATVASPASRKPCISPAHRQFDFWLGDWDVTNPAGKVVGANLIKLVLGGCVLHESWVATGGGFAGQSHNIYDAARNVWHQTWVDMSGTLLVLEGQFDNGVMRLTDKDVAGKKDANTWNEIAWRPHADGSVQQVWRTTTDGGKTWKIAFDGKYVKSSRSLPRAAP